MIGTLPVYDLAPLEYRYALDAAMALVGSRGRVLVRCQAPELLKEVRHRLPNVTKGRPAEAGLWVEPQVDAWQVDLRDFRSGLETGAVLVVVASRPMARRLPERRDWESGAMGLHRGGLGRLRRALGRARFRVEAEYGLHPVTSVRINLWSRILEALGRPEAADRLRFKARLSYCVTGPLASFSTVALLLARKEEKRSWLFRRPR